MKLTLRPQTGVLITEVFALSPCKGTLAPGDVLLQVDGIAIGNDGSIPFRNSTYCAPLCVTAISLFPFLSIPFHGYCSPRQKITPDFTGNRQLSHRYLPESG